ncbi:MAG: type II toxin-antitoxin system RelE/ParE family toxin [Pseudomonas sp.]
MFYRVLQTPRFVSWLASVRDLRAKVAIARRVERAGYRVYFTVQDGAVIILLAGGDKSSQSDDIQLARKLVKDIRS